MITVYALMIITIIANEGGIGPYSVFSLSFVFVIATSDLIHYFSKLAQLQESGAANPIIEAKNHIFTPCLLTTVTTMLGFSSLMINEMLPIRFFGLYCALGSLFCFLLTFYVLPELLASFNFKLPPRTIDLTLRSQSITKFVLRRPFPIIASFALFSLLMIYGTTKLEQDDNFYTKFIDSHPFTQSVKEFDQRYNMAGTVDILLSPKNGENLVQETHLDTIEAFQRAVEAIDKVEMARSLPDVLNDVGRSLASNEFIDHKEKEDRVYSIFRIFRNFGGLDDIYNSYHNEARIVAQMNSMKSTDLEGTIAKIEKIIEQARFAAFEISVTGFAVVRNYINSKATDNFIKSFGLSLFFIFVTFLLYFRSLKISLVAMIPNLVPLISISGLMGLLGITMESNLVVMVCITIGLAVDDTIHFVYELKKQMDDKTQSFQEALQKSLGNTSRALISTTALFIFSFCCFFLSDLRLFFQAGFFILASLVIALLCDFILLPAILLRKEAR